MDPLSHAVFGRALTAAIDNRLPQSRGTRTAAILGALSPDIDLVFVPFGWDIYLRVHSIGTHSLIGSVVMGIATAATVRLFVRAARFRAFAAAALIGALSHLGLDIACGAPLQLLWPMSERKFPLPLIAMADPWLVGLFIAGAVALAIARGPRKQVYARALLATVVVFLAAKGILLRSALAAARASAETTAVTARVVEASWGSWTDWYVFDRTPTELKQWRATALDGPATLLLSMPLARESTRVAASRRLDTVANFLHVHELGFATEKTEDSGREIVLWSDLRFCRPEAPAPSPESRAPSPGIACQLWFGGVFGPDGKAIRQEVRVGGWVQDRATTR